MSGIYIPGLSMPRKTGIVSIVLSGDGSALLCEDGAYSEIQVIPVPEHGRLIDADALIERMEFEIKHFVPTDTHSEGMLCGYKAAVRTLRECAPTIIPASEEGE